MERFPFESGAYLDAPPFSQNLSITHILVAGEGKGACHVAARTTPNSQSENRLCVGSFWVHSSAGMTKARREACPAVVEAEFLAQEVIELAVGEALRRSFSSERVTVFHTSGVLRPWPVCMPSTIMLWSESSNSYSPGG